MSADTPDRSARDTGDWDRADFVEEMGLLWEAAGAGRMDGRVVAYLLVTDVPYVSSAELGRALRVSAGSISLVTRRLAEAGFLRRHAVPGERSHYFRVDDDVWGSFLAGERRYLDQQEQLADRALALLGSDEEAPRLRLRNMRDYMRWIRGSHHDLLARWRKYQSESRASGAEDGSARDDDTFAVGNEAGRAAAASPVPEPETEEISSRLSVTLSTVLAERLLPDALWAAAEPLLPKRSRGAGEASGAASERTVFTAVVYVLTAGCGWQQLPAQFGVSPATAHRRFTAWSKADLWKRWLDAVSEECRSEGAQSPHMEWCALVTEAATARRSAGGR